MVTVKERINQIYTWGLLVALMLLPWSNRLSTYALLIVIFLGLLTTTWQMKCGQLAKHALAFCFPLLYALYIIGMLYSQNITEGLRELEQKSALMIPMFILSSTWEIAERKKLFLTGFVYSCLGLTVTCLCINLVQYSYGQTTFNFDPYTQEQFNQLHVNNHPIWQQLSYISFGSPFAIYPAHLTLLLVFCIVIMLATDYFQNPIYRYPLLFWFVFIILLLSTRTGIVLLYGTISFSLLYHYTKTNQIINGLLRVFIFTIGLVVLVFALPMTRFRILEEPLIKSSWNIPNDPTKWNSINLHLMEWTAGIRSIKKNIFTGSGTGDVKDELKVIYNESNLGSFSFDYDAHNQFIQTFAELGLLGFLALAMCFIVPIRTGLQKKNIVQIALPVIVAFSCLSVSLLERQKVLMFYTIFVSILMLSQKDNVSDKD